MRGLAGNVSGTAVMGLHFGRETKHEEEERDVIVREERKRLPTIFLCCVLLKLSVVEPQGLVYVYVWKCVWI